MYLEKGFSLKVSASRTSGCRVFALQSKPRQFAGALHQGGGAETGMQDNKNTSAAVGPRAGPVSTALTNTVATRGHVESLRLRLQASAMVDTAPHDQGLEDYICNGPLLASAGVSAAQVHDSLSTWQELAVRLIEQLGFDAGNLSASERERIYHYYLPLYFWIDAQFRAHAAQQPDGKRQSMVVGISAPQGCGKTTVVESLQHLLMQTGRSVASVSIDDFYLTRAEQVQLAESLPRNDILQSRGNAGTHDLQLGASVLQKLRNLRDGESCALPRYDKATHAGQGDRAPESNWPVVQGPIDIVLFEGWMLGFAPVSSAAAVNVDPSLEPVNDSLKEYKAAWDSAVDSWIVIRVGSPECVYKWRLQAEVAMRASGKPGMSDEQIAAFVNRYMPAYKAYLPGLYSRGPTTCQPGRLLVVEVDAKRSPVPDQPSAIC